MTKLINMTPHTINIMDMNNNIIHSIESNGAIRCTTTRTCKGSICGIPVNETKFGELEGLPEEVEGTYYIVSAIAANAAKALGRTDCLITDDAVRNEAGQIIGCRALATV